MKPESFQHENVDYQSSSYLSKSRWISYWYQINEVHQTTANASVLEIGPGNNLVTGVLRGMGHQVKTVDRDWKTKPDYLTDVRQLSDTVQEQFDTVLCCEILEHLPFKDFEMVLLDLRKVSREHLIVTLPYSTRGTFTPYIVFKFLPFMKPISWLHIFPICTRAHIPTHPLGHQWEIGKKGYPLKRIRKCFKTAGWSIKKQYPIFENPYHYLFVCEKNAMVR
ncbi:methyltransferase type 11 [Patescibacteria group bacterium]|nr:MAG: methyltransferase type 11 [Patescibacteria group bacterium]